MFSFHNFFFSGRMPRQKKFWNFLKIGSYYFFWKMPMSIFLFVDKVILLREFVKKPAFFDHSSVKWTFFHWGSQKSEILNFDSKFCKIQKYFCERFFLFCSKELNWSFKKDRNKKFKLFAEIFYFEDEKNALFWHELFGPLFCMFCALWPDFGRLYLENVKKEKNETLRLS